MPNDYDIKELVIRDFQACVADLREQLEPLEAGWMWTGERRADGSSVDTTQSDIEQLRAAIAEYQRCIQSIEDETAG